MARSVVTGNSNRPKTCLMPMLSVMTIEPQTNAVRQRRDMVRTPGVGYALARYSAIRGMISEMHLYYYDYASLLL